MKELFSRLVKRDDRRTEAEIQADVRQFILTAPFQLDEGDLSVVSLESPVGDRRRIDVEVGSTVIEVKRDLRRDKPRREAEEQLSGYVEFRTKQTGLRYVGVLTDGTEWICYDLLDGKLRHVSQLVLNEDADDFEGLTVWLEGVLATARNISPTAENIERRLGAQSSSYALDRATLSSIYEKNKNNPTVKMKRILWSRLLMSALGTQFEVAIGRQRLTDPDRKEIHIPVYLGDSVQWQEQNSDLWTAGNLVIRADDRRELFGSELSFPDGLLDDAGNFDQLVDELANRASNRKPGAPVPSLSALFSRLAIPERYRATVEGTFRTMCRLHDEGRDHIWGYYVRNLARPLWLSREKNRVDVLVGNPPWLAFRHMTPEMQTTFRAMAEARGLWSGAEIATHQDLSGLFAIRACELYLRRGGRFGLVLPNAAIDREHYAGFRSGHYGGARGEMAIAFDPSWDLRRLRPHFFPRAASVVFGERIEVGSSRKMPDKVEVWTGRLKRANTSWSVAEAWIERKPGKVRYVGQLVKSPYAPAFTQGAILAPRVVFVVERQQAPSLGLAAGRVGVRSLRSVQEKKPWKDLQPLTGVLESEFVRPFFTGDNIFPFRIGDPFLAIVPCGKAGLLAPNQIEMYSGLNQWWEKAQALWIKHRSSERLSLTEQLDYQSKLSKQFPVPSLRIVYNRAGMHVVAAKITDRRALIASGLYWASVRTPEEADYLCGILNSPATTELVRPFMSYGKDERDIHKHVWEVPIPAYDPANELHRRLAQWGATAERLARDFALKTELHFAASRRHIREAIYGTDEGREMNDIVFELIG